MKKFLATLFIFFALAVIMCPATTAYASAEKISSIQTVECSWWGKVVNGDYYKGEEGRRRWQQEQRRRQQQQWQQQQRRQQEQQRRQQLEAQRRRQQQQRY